MAKGSISPRWQALVLTVFVLACVAFLAFRFWPRDNLQNLLGRLPAGSAIQLYVDVPAAIKGAQGVKLPPALSFGLAAGNFEAVALGLAEHELYVVSAGRFSSGLVEAALLAQGVQCSQPIALAPCQASLAHGTVSLHLIDDRTLYVTTAATADSVRRQVDTSAAQAAFGRGGIAWASIDPALLDQAMENPPANWINLQLIARALQPATEAYLALIPQGEGAFLLELEAHGAKSEAGQVQKVLAGLNDMAIALTAREPEASEQWSPVLKSFENGLDDEVVWAKWTLSAKDLARLLSAD